MTHENDSSPVFHPCDTCDKTTHHKRLRWHDGDLVRVCDACLRTFKMTGDIPDD